MASLRKRRRGVERRKMPTLMLKAMNQAPRKGKVQPMPQARRVHFPRNSLMIVTRKLNTMTTMIMMTMMTSLKQRAVTMKMMLKMATRRKIKLKGRRLLYQTMKRRRKLQVQTLLQRLMRLQMLAWRRKRALLKRL